MRIYQFHQLVALDRGPIYTCISDLLKGDIYQISNLLLEKFENRQYEEIPELMQTFIKAELVIEVEPDTFILPLYFENRFDDKDEHSIILQLERGSDLQAAIRFFTHRQVKIKLIHYFDDQEIENPVQGIPVIFMSKDFSLCESLSTITGDFSNIDEATYLQNKLFHNCWGHKIAVTADGNIHPCIYSRLVIGNIFKDSFEDTWAGFEVYRKLTKDKIEKCRACEFKYVCFDCREIAYRVSGDLYAANPYCTYNPFTGDWGDQETI